MRKKNTHPSNLCVRSKSPVSTLLHHAAQTSKLSDLLLLVAVAKVWLDEGRSREEFRDRSIQTRWQSSLKGVDWWPMAPFKPSEDSCKKANWLSIVGPQSDGSVQPWRRLLQGCDWVVLYQGVIPVGRSVFMIYETIDAFYLFIYFLQFSYSLYNFWITPQAQIQNTTNSTHASIHNPSSFLLLLMRTDFCRWPSGFVNLISFLIGY